MSYWIKVKNGLKYLWPLTIRRFNQRMDEARQEQNAAAERRGKELQKAAEELSSAMREQTEKISEELRREKESVDQGFASLRQELCHEADERKQAVAALREKQEELKDKLESVSKTLKKEDKILYYCPHEVRRIDAGGFLEASESPDYLAEYQRLVAGLDRDSIETVNRILCRHKLVMGKSQSHIDLFTEEEQRIIRWQRQEFYADVLQIAPDIFVCGKYLLATPKGGMGYTETTLFCDKAGFGELEHPERVRDKDILDLGAFIGDSSLVMAECTDKNVYAFEPNPVNFELLKKTIELNEQDRVIPVHAGIGAERGEAVMPDEFGMGFSLNEKHGAAESMARVPVVSVDEFVSQHHLTVGLIKVDVEGFEQAFLKGAEQTLRTQRPALLLSMYHNASDFFHLKPMLEDMDLGYRFKVHKEINEHIHYDTMLIAEVE